jgi:CRISPR-associated protein Cmr5
MNGLGQALASELAMARIGDNNSGDENLSSLIEEMKNGGMRRKPDEWAHHALFCIVQDWLQECNIYSKGDLMEALVSGNQNRYVRAQAETLAYLEWVKKFSQAFLRKGGRGE